MAKPKKTEQQPAEEAAVTPVIEPVDISVTESPKSQLPSVEIPAGHVLVVALDATGVEIAGSEFFYPERSYRRFYSDESKYRIKKKANQ